MNKRLSGISFLTAGFLAMTLGACDSDGDTQRLSNLVFVADVGFTSLEINGDTDTVIETGGSTQLSLEAFTDDSVIGSAISPASASWSSSDSRIAEVDSDTGIVFGGGEDGGVSITASFGNLSATTQVRVSSAQLERIVIEPAGISVNECSATQFAAVGIYEGEEETRNITDSVEWSVAPTNGVFDKVGLLRVTSGGTLAVTATRVAILDKPEITHTDEILVLSDNLTAIDINPDAGELANGSPLQYRAFPVYANSPDDRTEITGNVEWRLDDAAESGDFADLDDTFPGLVTPSRAGDGVLSAECIGTGISQSLAISAAGSGQFAELNIEAANSDRDFPLQVVWRSTEIEEQLVARAVYTDQQGSLDVTNEDGTEWEIIADPNNVFAWGDNKGLLVISGEGRATIEVTFTDDDGNEFPPKTATVVSAAL